MCKQTLTSAHLGMVGLLQLFLVQPHLSIMLLPHLMQSLRQLVLILNLPPGIHLHQTCLMLPSRLIDLLQGEKQHKTKLLTQAIQAPA